jgi:hypothetical protein
MLLYGTLFTILSENAAASAIKCVEIERACFYDFNRSTGLQHQSGERSRYSDHSTSWAIRGSNPGGGNTLLFPRTSRPSLNPCTHPAIRWVQGFIPEVRAARALC